MVSISCVISIIVDERLWMKFVMDVDHAIYFMEK